MNSLFEVIGIATVLGAAAVAVHLILSWMARRGWVYYRTENRPRPSSLGLIEEIYQPSTEHVIDEQTRERTETDQDERGEGLDPERP
jgi:hypothetical protein